MDIKAAYLYADLKEDIFMKIPEGDPNLEKDILSYKKLYMD